MVEVQPDVIHRAVKFELVANPRSAVHVGDFLVGVRQADTQRIAGHQPSGRLVVAASDRHMAMRLRFVVMGHQADLLPGVGVQPAASGPRCVALSTALPSASTTCRIVSELLSIWAARFKLAEVFLKLAEDWFNRQINSRVPWLIVASASSSKTSVSVEAPSCEQCHRIRRNS